VGLFRRKKSEAELSLERLQSGMASTAPPAATGPFSMTIEDVFSITGRGTVVTGRVTTGVVRVGMPVTLTTAAGALSTTVTGVEMFRKKLDEAVAGDNVGLLLDGVTRDAVAQGDIIQG
jgi:elongation factor Tu